MTSFDKALHNATSRGVSKVEFYESTTRNGNGKGWAFAVYWENRSYPNFTSSVVKTNKGAVRNATRYLNTGKFSIYGNAE